MNSKNPPPQELKSFKSLASFHLHKLSRLSDRIHEQHYQRHFGISLREYRIVALTGALVNPPFRRICEESDLDKAHVSRLVNRLVRRNLLTKTAAPSDQRSITVSLTEEGVALHRRLFEESSKLNESLLSVLSAPQRAAFMAALQTLHASARQMTEALREAEQAAPARRRIRKKSATRPAVAKSDPVVDPKPAPELL